MTATMTNAAERRLMARVEHWLGAHVVGIVMLGVLVTAALIAGPFVLPLVGSSFAGKSINWSVVSAIPAIVGSFGMAMSIPWRSGRVVAQLADRRVLQISGEKLDNLQRDLRARAARAARWGSAVGGIAILGPTVLVVTTSFYTVHGLDLALDIGATAVVAPATLLCGLLGGYYAGYAISVGRWAAQLRAHGVTLRVRPGHPDGAAGWGPLGDLYFFQALMLTIPALYYGVWSYFFAANIVDTNPSDRDFQIPYFVFLLIILVIEILAFLAPAWTFHDDMRRQKLALASETDALSDRILTVQARAVETDDPEEASTLSQQMATMTSLYTARVEMSTWPFKTKVTVRFVLANLGLLLPLVVQLVQFHNQL